jgi:hypothetical protein
MGVREQIHEGRGLMTVCEKEPVIEKEDKEE